MNRFFYLLLIFLLLGSGYLAYLKLNYSNTLPKITSKKFQIEGKLFTPIVLNYILSYQTNGYEYWGTPTIDYGSFYTSKTASHKALVAQFDSIKEMGFNTVRIVGIGEPNIDKEKGTLSFRLKMSKTTDTLIFLDNEKAYKNYFNAIEEVLKIANQSKLQVIFLNKLSPNHSTSSNLHLKKIAQRFKNNKTILALDLFNEPLYFDSPEKEKKEIYIIVKKWQETVKGADNNRLTTIGLEGIREVFRWDPNILSVDFISYHPYEYEPEQVRNEIYWYGKYTKKPWIIGETAIPADNDSVPYNEQAQFAKITMQQTFNCGGTGYSWWQYKDVNWGLFHADFMGVVNKNGKTKPVANAIKSTATTQNTDSCLCLPNYFNYSESNAFKIVGTLVNKAGNPIEGGVVLAWNEDWTHSYHTITKKDGSFELLGSYPFYHWMASATKHTTIRDDLNPNTATIQNKMPTIDLGKLKIKKLWY